MTAKALRVADYLGHMRTAILRIESYVAGRAFADFAAQPMVQDAVIRNLEVIGEAGRNIERHDPAFLLAHPDLPLRAAAEMRNALAHGYFTVDLAIVWRTVQTDLPRLRRQIEDALSDLG